MEMHLSDEQAWFRRDRSTTCQILILRESQTKRWHILNCFIDFENALDFIKHEVIWVIWSWNKTNRNSVKHQRKIAVGSTSWWKTGRLVVNHGRHKAGRSDIANNVYLISWKCVGPNKGKRNRIYIHGHKIKNVKFAEDIDLLEKKTRWATRKSETDQCSRTEDQHSENHDYDVWAGEQQSITEELWIENVTDFVYHGSLLTWDNDCSNEISCTSNWSNGRVQECMEQHGMHISTWTKLSIIKKCVISVLLYACETRTLRKRDIDSLMASERKCYKRIRHMHWR